MFSYVGLTFFSYKEYEWSWQFTLAEFIIIIIGRFTGTLGLLYLLVLFGHKNKIKLREVIFIGYAGLIRGAIAFGLVITINPDIVK